MVTIGGGSPAYSGFLPDTGSPLLRGAGRLSIQPDHRQNTSRLHSRNTQPVSPSQNLPCLGLELLLIPLAGLALGFLFVKKFKGILGFTMLMPKVLWNLGVRQVLTRIVSVIPAAKPFMFKLRTNPHLHWPWRSVVPPTKGLNELAKLFGL
jgi:hypothetical protein